MLLSSVLCPLWRVKHSFHLTLSTSRLMVMFNQTTTEASKCTFDICFQHPLRQPQIIQNQISTGVYISVQLTHRMSSASDWNTCGSRSLICSAGNLGGLLPSNGRPRITMCSSPTIQRTFSQLSREQTKSTTSTPHARFGAEQVDCRLYLPRNWFKVGFFL